MSSSPSLHLALGLLTILLTACAALPGKGKEHREHYYLNANLAFALEYPADWIRQGDPDSTLPTVRWSDPTAQAGASVLSLPPSQARGGVDRLEMEWLAAHPDFTLTSGQTQELPAAPARQLIGDTPERIFLVYLVTSSRRAFILEFSAPPAEFDSFRPLFREMAESFTILD